MEQEKFIELFELSADEIQLMIDNNDFGMLEKKYKIALKKWHPDNRKTGDPVKFLEMRNLYALVKSGDVRSIFGADSSKVKGTPKVFAFEQIRLSGGSVITDINGVSYERKRVLGSGLAYSEIRFKVMLDDTAFGYTVLPEYRDDNKYYVEVAPEVDKERFKATKHHKMEIQLLNSIELSTQIEWDGMCRDFTMLLRGDRVNIRIRVMIDFISAQ